MYLKKEISISFFIITMSASNLYMPMIWSYVFLLDFLIPILCGPDLQCSDSRFSGGVMVTSSLQPILLEKTMDMCCTQQKTQPILDRWMGDLNI